MTDLRRNCRVRRPRPIVLDGGDRADQLIGKLIRAYPVASVAAALVLPLVIDSLRVELVRARRATRRARRRWRASRAA